MHANLYAKGCIYLLPEVYCFITRHMAFYTYCQEYFKNLQLRYLQFNGIYRLLSWRCHIARRLAQPFPTLTQGGTLHKQLS